MSSLIKTHPACIAGLMSLHREMKTLLSLKRAALRTAKGRDRSALMRDMFYIGKIIRRTEGQLAEVETPPITAFILNLNITLLPTNKY
ncbi:hypothetical protein [Rufibacter soli]